MASVTGCSMRARVHLQEVELRGIAQPRAEQELSMVAGVDVADGASGGDGRFMQALPVRPLTSAASASSSPSDWRRWSEQSRISNRCTRLAVRVSFAMICTSMCRAALHEPLDIQRRRQTPALPRFSPRRSSSISDSTRTMRMPALPPPPYGGKQDGAGRPGADSRGDIPRGLRHRRGARHHRHGGDHRFARALRTIRRMTGAGGPMKISPARSRASANSARSDRNP